MHVLSVCTVSVCMCNMYIQLKTSIAVDKYAEIKNISHLHVTMIKNEKGKEEEEPD